MIISGIYQIQSKIKPNKIYIGSAVNISERWRIHLFTLKTNIHRNIKLQRHYNKYGKLDLQFSILLGCEKGDLIKHEQFFIDSYKPFFNICQIANSCLGIKRSNESNEKNRQWHLGRKQSIETITKRNVKNTGRKNTEETKQKMRDTAILNNNKPYIKLQRHLCRLGTKASEETRKKQSDSHKGIKMSEENKIKLSKRVRGNKFRLGKTPWNKGKELGFVPVGAFKKGQAPWNKGKKGVQQNGGMKNKSFSEESKKKISESLKRWYRNNKLNKIA